MSDVGAATPGPGFPANGAAARPAPGHPRRPARAGRPALAAMLEARSVALVGASPRPGSLGERMVSEVTKSPARPEVYLVNPRHEQIGGRPCHASLADLPGPVDLVLLAVPDAAVEEQLALAARRGDRSAVLFGSAHDLPGHHPARQRPASTRTRQTRAPTRAAPGPPARPGTQAAADPARPGWPPRRAARGWRSAVRAAWASST